MNWYRLNFTNEKTMLQSSFKAYARDMEDAVLQIKEQIKTDKWQQMKLIKAYATLNQGKNTTVQPT